jgi:nuclease S1
MTKIILVAAVVAVLAAGPAFGWDQEGHSIVAEVAQGRLSPQAAAAVERLIGKRSLASIASWADDIRDARPDTYNWHFVDIPIQANDYQPARDCKDDVKGDCVVARSCGSRATCAAPPATGRSKR